MLYWHILNSFAVPSEELKCLMKFTDKSDSARGFNSDRRKIDIGYRGCSILAGDYVTSSLFSSSDALVGSAKKEAKGFHSRNVKQNA